MHSGYPIMAHENSTAEDSCAVWGDGGNLRGAHRPGKLLLEGDWGLFHELGHHFQRRRWTYKSCGEVTVNLFSMYSMMTIIGRKIPTRDMENVREGHEDAEKFIAERIRSEGGGRAIYSAAHNRSPITDALDDWSPWVGLTMYVDVIETFGWDLLRNVLRSYEKDGTYDEEPDPTEWWTRVSRACGKGLSIYCRVWGVPIDLNKMDREGGNPNDQWLPAWIQQKLIVMVWRLSYFVSCKVGDWILLMAATAAKATAKPKGKEIKTKDIRKNGKKAASVHKEDTKKSESSSESIDDIFGALKKSTRSTSTSTKTKDTPKEQQQPAAPSRPQGSADDPLGLGNRAGGDRKRTEEGYKIYTEEELKIGQGGSNNKGRNLGVSFFPRVTRVDLRTVAGYVVSPPNSVNNYPPIFLFFYQILRTALSTVGAVSSLNVNYLERSLYVPIDAGALMDEGFEGTEEDKQKEIPSRGPIKYDVPMVDFSSGSKDTDEVEGNRSSDRSKILNLDGQLDSAPKRSAAGGDAAATSSSSSEVSGGWLLSKLTCGLTLSYIQDNFFDVTSRDVEGRLLLAIWPYRLSLLSPSSSLQLPSPGSTGSPEGGRVAQFFTRHFADSIQLLSSFRTNPDLWGPFWICTTAVIFLTATANFSRQLLSGAKQGEIHTTDYTLAGTAWLVLFGVVILAPLITLGLLLWITNRTQQTSGDDETGWWDRLPAWLRPATARHNTYVIDDAATNDGGSYAVPPAHGQQGGAKASLWLLLTSSYGYSVAVMLPLSILWMVPLGWVKSLACGLGARSTFRFLTSMVFIYVSLLRTGGVDGASGASPVLQRLGVAEPSQKVCVEVAVVTAAVAIVMEGGIWASC
ncbi:hypothetical protein FOZ63_025305, partial [Perkinsus olseni]